MSLVFPTPARGLFAILVVIACTTASAQQKPQKAELLRSTPPSSAGLNFIEPNATRSTNVVTEAPPPKRFFGISEKASRKPFELFSPEDSFNGVIAPPVQRTPSNGINDRRAKELRDRRKNWVFTTPEELYGIETPEEMMGVQEYGPDGEQKVSRSAMERYYQRNDRNAMRMTNRSSSEILPGWMRPGERDEKPPADEKETSLFFSKRIDGTENSADQSANSFFGPSRNNLGNGLGDFFNSNVTDPSLAKDAAAREARMQQFKQLFSAQPAASSASSPLTATASPNPFSSGSSVPARPAAALPSVSSASAPVTTPFPAYAPPPVTPTRTVSPAAAAFELPKRKF